MDVKTTELTTWLASHSLQKYIQPFYDIGCYFLADLEDDELVASVVKDAAVTKQIGALLKTAAAPPVDAGPGVELPTLPAGTTLDLSGHSVTIDDVKFELPSQFSAAVTPGREVSGADLGQNDWLLLAKRTGILFGMRMDRALIPTGRVMADRAALVWKIPANDDFYAPGEGSTDTSTLRYTSETSSLVEHQILDATAAGGYLYCAASFRVGRDVKQAQSALRRCLHMTGLWLYPKTVVKLNYCTDPAPAFLDAVRAALAKPAPQQFAALQAVFDDFGHAIAAEATLGGQMYFESTRTTTGVVSEQDVTSTVQAAVAAKRAGAKAKASATFKDGSGAQVTAQEIVDTSTFKCVGGDESLNGNPKDWPGTVKDPMSWKVIVRGGLKPLTDWLPDDLKNRVQAVWDAGLKQAWNGPPPRGYVFPDFYGQKVTIATSTANQPRTVLAGYMHPSEDSIGERGYPAPIAGYPPRVADQLLANPAGNRLGWQFVYSGVATERDGPPIYWILTADGSGALGAISWVDPGTDPNAPPSDFVWFAPSSAIKAPDAVASPEKHWASWTIAPADPSGYYGMTFARSYVVRNVTTGKLLGPIRMYVGTYCPRTGLDVPPALPATPAGWAPYCWDIVAYDG